MTTLTQITSTRRLGPGLTLRNVASMAWRNLVQIKHNPMELVDLSLQPVMFLLLFVYVFGGQMDGSPTNYLQYALAGLIAQNSLFATMNTSIGVNTDISKGVFDRFRSLPIARSAPLAGRIIADMFKQVWSLALMLSLGLLIGFNLDGGLLGAFGAAALLVAFAVAMSWFAVLIGVIAKSAEKVQIFAFVLIMPLTFTSSAFVRPETMPGLLETWASNLNPVSHLADATRGLLGDGPVAQPLAWTLVWAAALAALFFPLAMRAYRSKLS